MKKGELVINIKTGKKFIRALAAESVNFNLMDLYHNVIISVHEDDPDSQFTELESWGFDLDEMVECGFAYESWLEKKKVS